MTANGKSRGRARFEQEPTSGRRNDVLWAIAHARDLSTTERCALFAVEAFVAFKERNVGWCAPSIGTLSAAIGLSERRTQETLRALQRRGWLAIEAHFDHGYQTSNRYRVTPPGALRDDDEPAEPDPNPVH